MPRNLLIQVGNGSEWEVCRVFHMSHGRNHYIRLATETDHITLYGFGDTIAKKFHALLALLDELDKSPLTQAFITRRDVTPLETIDKFHNSQTLQPHASDVESALQALISDVDRIKKAMDPARLFDEDGQPVRGAQARIAKILGVTNAGAYRQRILDTLEALQNEHIKSTTTDEPARSWAGAA